MRILTVLALSTVLAVALAGCTSGGGGNDYPDAYILKANEIPASLKLSEVPPDVPFEITNPGKVPDAFVQQYASQFANFAPNEIWGEYFEEARDADNDGGGLALFAGFWVDQKKVGDAVAALKAQQGGIVCRHDYTGAILKDGQVLVVIGGDESMEPYLGEVLAKLEKKAPGLTDVCG